MSDAGAPIPATPAVLVVDASVVIQWHVTEVHAEAASRLLGDSGPGLHVPDLVYPEVGNILWKKTRRGDLTVEQARAIARLVAAAPLEVHPSAFLFEAAFEIAASTGRTVYDSLYVALAVQLGTRLVTADERLFNALKDGPLGSSIAWIEDDLGIHAGGDEADDFVIPACIAPYSAAEIELLVSFFTGDRLLDEDLINLKNLKHLNDLYIVDNAHITDAGLVHLDGLTELETLFLSGTAITDAGLAPLRGLTGLRRLNLARTAITDAGLVHLGGMTGLRVLELWGTQITDAGVAHLRAMSGLTRLDLAHTLVTREGIEGLRHALPGVEIES